MEQIIDITTVTSKKLLDREYESVLPELYALDTYIEINPWHDHQTVLNHIIGVYAGLETLITSPEMGIVTNKLKEKISTKTRMDILKIAVLLHDIGKSDTFITNDKGWTLSPFHELLGAARVNHFSKRFGLTHDEETRVERIVQYHGFISDVLNSILATGEKEKYGKIFREIAGSIHIELVIMLWADLLGSDLEKLDSNAFDDRITLLKWLIKII